MVNTKNARDPRCSAYVVRLGLVFVFAPHCLQVQVRRLCPVECQRSPQIKHPIKPVRTSTSAIGPSRRSHGFGGLIFVKFMLLRVPFRRFGPPGDV